MNGSKEPGSLRLVATLTLAGLLSGVILVGVYLMTQPRIERNRAEALYAAIHQVLPGTTEIRTYVARDGGLEPFESARGALPSEPAVFAGYRADGSLVGFAVPGDGPGFQDTIQLIYGYDPTRRTIIGMQVLDSRETPGLGDKIASDPEFRKNFRALAIDPAIVAVKRGQKKKPNEVDCITGATISSEAVVGILRRSTQKWAPLLAQPPPTNEVSQHAPTARH